jgi:hypothetical protein
MEAGGRAWITITMNSRSSRNVAQHTATPWIAYESKQDKGTIYIQKQINADRVFPSWAIACIPNYQNNDAANAAFIVRAVNSHAQLVAALEYMVANAESEGWSEFMLADARAALASAQC